MIDASGRQVSSGVDLVQQTGEALTQIADAADNISTHVSQIAKAAEEQSRGILETNDAIQQLDSVTQHNAAMFEETNAVTQSLAQQADQLAKAMAGFKLVDNVGTAMTSTRARTAASKPLSSAATPPSAQGNLALAASDTGKNRLGRILITASSEQRRSERTIDDRNLGLRSPPNRNMSRRYEQRYAPR